MPNDIHRELHHPSARGTLAMQRIPRLRTDRRSQQRRRKKPDSVDRVRRSGERAWTTTRPMSRRRCACLLAQERACERAHLLPTSARGRARACNGMRSSLTPARMLVRAGPPTARVLCHQRPHSRTHNLADCRLSIDAATRGSCKPDRDCHWPAHHLSGLQAWHPVTSHALEEPSRARACDRRTHLSLTYLSVASLDMLTAQTCCRTYATRLCSTNQSRT